MRKLIFYLFLVGCYTSAHAQYQRLALTENNFSIDISLIDNTCILNNAVSGTRPDMQNVDVSLENGDIVISYQLRKGERDQNYIVSLNAELNGSTLPIFQEDLIGDIGKEIQASNQEEHKIIWTRLFERYVDLSGELIISLSTELWGIPKLPFGIECGKPPVFGGKQLLPHIVTAGVGIASLGTSLIYERKSNDTYENDYLTQNFEEQAEPFYQQANDDNKKGLILRYTGMSILALDAIWYVYRSIRHKKKVNAYNESCRDNSAIQFRPIIEIQTSQTGSSQIGFSLTYQIGR